MVIRRKTPEYVVSQLAGSCRLEGIRVSAEDEKLMQSIVTGEVDGKALARQIAQRIRNEHAR